MDANLQLVNLAYVEEISGGDNDFKKEMIEIFIEQIPDFISNLNRFLIEKNCDELAKEAHTAKSSVLIFKMEETGELLKKIQKYAENEDFGTIPVLLNEVKTDMEKATVELTATLSNL